jgi:glutaminyl-tRNA synthetase
MAVLRPLKVVIEDYPEDKTEALTVSNHPKNESMGTRTISFTREIYIDRSDFAEDPPKGFKRLVPGGEVRLRNAYVIRCERVVRDDAGEILELRCSHDAETLGRNPQGRKVKGVIHWVSAAHARFAEVRLYDRLFRVPEPGAGKQDFLDDLNPESLRTLSGCVLEPSLNLVAPGERFQFEREGYFVADKDSRPDRAVFNRTVGLRDTWAKLEQSMKGKS